MSRQPLRLDRLGHDSALQTEQRANSNSGFHLKVLPSNELARKPGHIHSPEKFGNLNDVPLKMPTIVTVPS
jgi:hypothetical protein